MNRLYLVFMLVVLVGCSSLVKLEYEQKNVEQIKKSVVRIISKNQITGKKQEGTGFIVGVSNDKTYIITVSHVVNSDPKPTVEFFENNKFKAEVLDSEPYENGLTLLSVKGLIPYDSIPLYLPKEHNLSIGDTVFTFGFPRGGSRWSHDNLSYSGPKHRNLLFSGSDIKEGNSGCPVIKGEQVVAIITSMTNDASYAIPVESIRGFLKGATGGQQVIYNMEKWKPYEWHKTQEARLENIKFINELPHIKALKIKLKNAEQARIKVENELKQIKKDNNKTKLVVAEQNRKQVEIEILQVKDDIKKAEQQSITTMLSQTKVGRFMSKLQKGDYLVIVGSYKIRKNAEEVVKNIRARYPELLYRQIDNYIYIKYDNFEEDGIFYGVNKYWAVYIGGLYTHDSANKLRNYIINELQGFRKDIYIMSPYVMIHENI